MDATQSKDRIDDGTDGAPSDVGLARVAAMVRRQHQLQLRIDELEDDLRDARKLLRAIAEEELPKAMGAVGLVAPTSTTISGLKVSLEERYRCGQLEYPPQPRRGDDDVPRARDPLAAFAWIDREGHGDLPKNQVVVTMGRDSADVAAELLRVIRSHPKANSFEVLHRRVVLWNTLAAFSREQVTRGGDPPLDLLGVQRVVQAKVAPPKEREG